MKELLCIYHGLEEPDLDLGEVHRPPTFKMWLLTLNAVLRAYFWTFVNLRESKGSCPLISYSKKGVCLLSLSFHLGRGCPVHPGMAYSRHRAERDMCLQNILGIPAGVNMPRSRSSSWTFALNASWSFQPRRPQTGGRCSEGASFWNSPVVG